MAKKIRITVTLDPQTVERIDKLIDGEKIRSRSHAIEFFLSQNLKPKIEQAVILAGGKGVRWRPLTYQIPKALIPIKGKPILEIIIESLKNYSIKKIFVVIGTLGEKIKEYFGDGKKLGVKIYYVQDKKQKGTAPALKSVENFIKKETFLLWYVDELAEIDLSDFVNFHFEHKGIATMAISSISDPKGYGIVKMKGPKIVEFTEKPKKEKIKSYLVNAGIFVFEPEIFNYILPSTLSLEKEVFPKLVKEKKLFGYFFGGKWFDIGIPENYLKALKEWK
ncbi:NTP transferase domain-containing protein [Candidatus Parcubacteria bacterium]|nr:NTP transferase domain-containing protein [Candidatus Parcubacteria bacterium]